MNLRRCAVPALLVSLCVASLAGAQGLSATRFTIGGNFILSDPKEGFGQNIGNTAGGGASVMYNVLRSGFLGMRMDVTETSYGREHRQIPISPYTSRVLLDLTTSNTVTALTWGPELMRPTGRIRPYVNFGYSKLFFRTTSSVDGSEDSEGNGGISTTNHKDSSGGWAYGGGLRIGLGHGAKSPVSLDFGMRYHRGGAASYLQKGSIVDNPDGSISISSLSSRTPLVMYMVGVKIHLPFDAKQHCGRFLC